MDFVCCDIKPHTAGLYFASEEEEAHLEDSPQRIPFDTNSESSNSLVVKP